MVTAIQLSRDIQNTRQAAAFIDWLHDEGQMLVSAMETCGGEAWAARATAVLTELRHGAMTADHVEDLRAMCELLRECLGGGLPPVCHEDDMFVRRDPEDPVIVEMQICAEALGRGVAALAAVVLARVCVSRGGCHR